MATTSIWRVKGWLGKVVVYVENPDKTTNPKFYTDEDMTEQDGQELSDVIRYAVNSRKTQSTGVADETSADYLTWNVAAETVSIYLLFQQFGRRSFKRINKQISYIAKYSFGIYLSHPLILSLFTFIDFFPTFITPIIGVPLFTVVTILLSLIVSWAIRRIPRIGSLVT